VVPRGLTQRNASKAFPSQADTLTGGEDPSLSERSNPSNSGGFSGQMPRPVTSGPVFQLLQDKYRVIAELGKGGMATVYLAVHCAPGGFQRLQVVKRLKPQLADDAEFLSMFVDEARLA